jgi:hypothetical protein
MWAALAGTSGSCTGLTLATVGTVAGAVGSAFATGNDIYQLGKIDTAEMARYDQALSATRAAAADLHLATKLDRQDPDGTSDLSFEDDKGAPVGVHVEPRAETLVRIRVDVGFFGSEPTARLFLGRLRTHLPTARAPTTGPNIHRTRVGGDERQGIYRSGSES